MKDEEGMLTVKKLKLWVWSISAGIVVAFFFSSNFLKFATGFSPGSEILLISPLFCGFILGILTTMDELFHSVLASIILTVTSVVLITMSLFAPVLFNVSSEFLGDYYTFVIQNVMISIVLIFPLALTTTVIGKVFGEYALLSHIYKAERALLRSETLKWYQMLEEAAGEETELKPIGWKPEVQTSEGTEEEASPEKSQVLTEDIENTQNEF